MENPYQILRRFIHWEIQDLQAMIETIDSKNQFQKRMHDIKNKQSSHSKELTKLQKGNTLKSAFQTKAKKIGRITDLSDKIENEEKEFDCAECLQKIIYLYLNEAAIPFFRLDKLGVYNGAINLYAQKQINNCNKISEFYSKVIGINQVEIGGNIGNVTILDEKSYIKSAPLGKLEESKNFNDSADSELNRIRGQQQSTMMKRGTGSVNHFKDIDDFQSSGLRQGPGLKRSQSSGGSDFEFKFKKN